MSTPASATRASRPPLPPVHVSLGAYGRLPHLTAIAEMLTHTPSEPALGTLSTHRVQICPQNQGRFDQEMATAVKQTHPHIEWRLHANVRVMEPQRIVDLCDWPQEKTYFAELARVSSVLQAPAYTAHAGRRERATVAEVLNHTRDAEQSFGIPVGIEGHYPSPRNTWLFSSWAEYRLLLESGVHYALDLSHLHILATRSGVKEWGLVREMLAGERCLEVHVSANDGSADQHSPLDKEPWWFPLLVNVHSNATVFSEGRQHGTRPSAITESGLVTEPRSDSAF